MSPRAAGGAPSAGGGDTLPGSERLVLKCGQPQELGGQTGVPWTLPYLPAAVIIITTAVTTTSAAATAALTTTSVVVLQVNFLL